jgi:electron transfer flavoprotein alpha subunit
LSGPRILVWLQEERGEIAASSWGAARLAGRFAAATDGSAAGAVLSAGTPLPDALDSSCGLESIWMVKNEALRLYTQEAYLAALSAAWEAAHADLLLAAATVDGQDLVVAASLSRGLPCATRAMALRWKDGAALVDQALPQGNFVRTVAMPEGRGGVAFEPTLLESGLPSQASCGEVCADDRASGRFSFGRGFPVQSYLVPPVSTVSPAAVPGGGRRPVPPTTGYETPKIVGLDVALGAPKWPAIALEPADPSTVDVSEAELVLAGGRGLGTAEGFAGIWDLGRQLGAAVGVTRPVVDEGWAPFERQIGQTGRQLHARAYIGLGISGAVHHTAGIADCGLVVAVNNDPNAPIFQVADFGFVADVHEVIAALRNEIRRRAVGSAEAGPPAGPAQTRQAAVTAARPRRRRGEG